MLDPKKILLLQIAQNALHVLVVVGETEVRVDDGNQKRRLAPVGVVDTTAVGHKTEHSDKLHKVVNHIPCRVLHAADEQTIDDPVGVPVVVLAKPPPGNDKGLVNNDQ